MNMSAITPALLPAHVTSLRQGANLRQGNDLKSTASKLGEDTVELLRKEVKELKENNASSVYQSGMILGVSGVLAMLGGLLGSMLVTPTIAFAPLATAFQYIPSLVMGAGGCAWLSGMLLAIRGCLNLRKLGK
jgi:hypothetical protein